MLLKGQENERLTFEIEIKQKQVRTAELEAEADKARLVKQAEGQAQVTVLRAKSESDAMQYTLPLKEKQIQTTRLFPPQQGAQKGSHFPATDERREWREEERQGAHSCDATTAVRMKTKWHSLCKKWGG